MAVITMEETLSGYRRVLPFSIENCSRAHSDAGYKSWFRLLIAAGLAASGWILLSLLGSTAWAGETHSNQGNEPLSFSLTSVTNLLYPEKSQTPSSGEDTDQNDPSTSTIQGRTQEPALYDQHSPKAHSDKKVPPSLISGKQSLTASLLAPVTPELAIETSTAISDIATSSVDNTVTHSLRPSIKDLNTEALASKGVTGLSPLIDRTIDRGVGVVATLISPNSTEAHSDSPTNGNRKNMVATSGHPAGTASAASTGKIKTSKEKWTSDSRQASAIKHSGAIGSTDGLDEGGSLPAPASSSGGCAVALGHDHSGGGRQLASVATFGETTRTQLRIIGIYRGYVGNDDDREAPLPTTSPD